MKSRTPNIKYIAWRSAEELNEATINWISELKFIKDEQHFLVELIENYTLQLIAGKTFEKSSKVMNELNQKRKQINPLLKRIIKHYNDLDVLVDLIDQPEDEKKYKDDHRQLLVEVSLYFDSYKTTKKRIFNLIKTVMKQSKQKKLLQ